MNWLFGYTKTEPLTEDYSLVEADETQKLNRYHLLETIKKGNFTLKKLVIQEEKKTTNTNAWKLNKKQRKPKRKFH